MTLLIQAVVVFLSAGAWFWLANRRWILLLRSTDHRLASDALVDPRSWVATAPWRIRTILRHLRTSDADPEIESWRVRTLNRFRVWVVAAVIAITIGPWLLDGLRSTVEASLRRYSDGFGILLVVVGAGMVSYYAVRMFTAVVRWGNAEHVHAREVFLPAAGLLITLAVLAIMPSLDLRKPR